MIAVPAIVAANQWRGMALGYLAFSGLYLGAAAFHVGPPRLLEPGTIDAAIPFVEETIWIYLTQFLLLPSAIVAARDDCDRTRAFYALLLATVLAAVVFVAWPTRLPRPEVTAIGATSLAWGMLYLTDTPFNCFPSLHVALAAIAGVALWRRGWRLAALLWPGAIAVSTLTTRQHVAWDVAGGLALAGLAWMLTPKVIRHERPQPAHVATHP